jgi:hypothetical protein
MDAMENYLPFHRRWNDHSLPAAVFPFADSNLVEVEHKFSATLGEKLEEFQVLDSLRNTFGFKKLFRMTGQKRVNPSFHSTVVTCFDPIKPSSGNC